MSQKGIGRLVQIGMKKEASRGVAETSATYWTPWMDLTLDEKKEFAVDDQTYGIVEDSTNLTQVKKWSEGSLSGNIADTTFGLVLYGMFGGYAVSGSNPYTHSFTVGQNAQHKSLTFFLHDPLAAVDYSYANGVIGKLDITAELKKFVSFNASLMAQSGASQSTFTPSTTTENRFVPQHLAAKFALDYGGLQGTKTATGTCSTSAHVTSLSISTSTLRVGMTVTGSNIPVGATIAAIVSASAFDLSVASSGSATSYTFGPAVIALKSAKVSINSNIEAQEVLGNLAPADFLNKEFSVEGTLEAIWQNESDFKTQFMGPTPLAIRLDFLNSDVSSNPELYIDMPKCTIQELGRPFKVKDLIYQSIKFKAVYSITDTLLAKMVLINAITTY
ncbi:MAG TPA: phage tail tube protein [Stellaceae bacterium]|jgi:hypothetical protein|nr:phage tail tube protein [Stellaceae bacterium]